MLTTVCCQILEADLRAIEPLLPQDLTSCQRSKPHCHFFVSVRVVQSVGSKQCSTFVKVSLQFFSESRRSIIRLTILSCVFLELLQESTCRPVWEEEFTLVVSASLLMFINCFLFTESFRSVQVEEANAELELVIYNFEKGGHKFVGSVIVKLAELESGETVDEWYPLQLHPSLRENTKCELEPLLRVQMTLAAFRWDRLPPRPIDYVPDYRMPTRSGPGAGTFCIAPSIYCGAYYCVCLCIQTTFTTNFIYYF
jgi:hypothetical protein